MDSDDGETGKQPFHTSNMSSVTLQQNPDTEVPDCLHTCTHPYHSSYSEEYLPPLIFRLDTLVTAKQTSVGLLIENGKVAEDADGCPIRDFPFLPRYISVKVSGWLLEYWMRTDTRLTYRDIKARMTVPASELPLDNTLNMRREREARTPLKLSCLTTRRGQIARKEVERVESWTPDQVSYNTTMDIEYKLAEGKKVPHRLRSKTLISAEPQYYPLDTFLDNGEIHEPGPRVKETIALFYRLSDTATAMDLSSWGDLPLEYLPKSWRPRSFPSRTKSGPRRRYMSKRIAMEDDDIMDWQSDTEQDGNGTPSASGHDETGDSSNLGESVPTYNMSDEEESLQFSGLPSVAHCNDSPGIAGSIVDRMVFEAESCHNTPRTNAPVSIGQWNPINGRKKLGFAPGLEERRGNTFMELARSERLMS
ncbi:hypothetical protein NFIA_036500 [Paecilomyces variotii No. 5]|uniref:Uncharacterized protein n=1 Tax=Byssochlamys spectabilis (strain No. 5 / NBRC 109023) TaxID=1356009 RepID=V5F7Y2_BYSSN|nr:hypothetical protein NFIA_036500 [Paecilomyces variotii No. 5]